MGTFELLMQGFQTVLTLQNIGAAAMGAILGLIVGAMPGIGSLAGVALLLPLTYKFNPTTAIIMLGALYYSNMYGGSFSAILLNIPGDSPAVCTTLDGYPMAKNKKRPGQALFTADMASFIGGTIGIIILTFTGPALANLGLKFGPSEMTAILLIAMTSISWLVGENPTKGCSNHYVRYFAGKYGYGYSFWPSKIRFWKYLFAGRYSFYSLYYWCSRICPGY